MSDTHVDKDKVIYIDYDKILSLGITEAVMVTISVGSVAGIGSVVGASPVLAIQQALKVLQKFKPTLTQSVIKIIKTGKEQGASKMKLEMNKTTAVGLNVGLIKKGVDTDTTIGVKTENRIVLEIEYK